MPGKTKIRVPEKRTRLSKKAKSRARSMPPVPEWIAEASARTPRALLCGWEKLLVENCGEVSAFTPERIVLETAIGPIRVEGAEMELQELRSDAVYVRGRVQSVTLPEKDA